MRVWFILCHYILSFFLKEINYFYINKHKYRPISLTTCLYKAVAEVLLERLKKVLPIENQMAFMADRQIIDASLIVNELIDYCLWNKKRV